MGGFPHAGPSPTARRAGLARVTSPDRGEETCPAWRQHWTRAGVRPRWAQTVGCQPGSGPGAGMAVVVSVSGGGSRGQAQPQGRGWRAAPSGGAGCDGWPPRCPGASARGRAAALPTPGPSSSRAPSNHFVTAKPICGRTRSLSTNGTTRPGF